MTEEEIVHHLKSGNQAAFNDLVRLYGPKVVNTCYRFLLNQQDAEDIAQEVFIEVYHSIKSFRQEAKLSTWIYRIAVTKSLDELKKRRRQKRFAAMGKILHIDDVTHWLSGGSMPDKGVQDDEKMGEITAALNTLPDNQRVAFTLSKIDGYTNSEIAEIMRTTTIAVESLIKRAKKQVSTALEIILKDTA
jgi:RNA polymerase sigma-70 factor, ECF subfamily